MITKHLVGTVAAAMVCNITIVSVRFQTVGRRTTGFSAVNILTWYGTILKWFAGELRMGDIFPWLNRKTAPQNKGNECDNRS